jgi:hypothetical protein
MPDSTKPPRHFPPPWSIREYIVYLRRVLIWAIFAAAVIATFYEFVKLASSP